MLQSCNMQRCYHCINVRHRDCKACLKTISNSLSRSRSSLVNGLNWTIVTYSVWARQRILPFWAKTQYSVRKSGIASIDFASCADLCRSMNSLACYRVERALWRCPRSFRTTSVVSWHGTCSYYCERTMFRVFLLASWGIWAGQPGLATGGQITMQMMSLSMVSSFASPARY